MKVLQFFAKLLLLLGGLNWGFIGLFQVDLIHTLSNDGAMDRVLYILMGLAAVQQIAGLKQRQRRPALPPIIG